jgi:tetratricopeptide (TPR) repeat protein
MDRGADSLLANQMALVSTGERLRTNHKPEPVAEGFAQRQLPWWIGVGATLWFGVTLSHWITLPSLGMVAKVSGWWWQPEPGQSLALVLFLPFRALPASWLPFLMNLFTAGCAALVLAQLARSIAILRQDIPPDDPLRKSRPGALFLTGPLAWIPPVSGVLVCALQVGFWEHATSASGEMPGLLCFAYALRCLLEFRLDPRQTWLSRCAFVYAVGMTDNWLMIACSPVLLAGLIWVKGFSPFLSFRFLRRMTLWALAGLTVYLVAPGWLSLSTSAAWDFWAALQTQWGQQKSWISVLRTAPFRLLVLTGVLPFLLLAVRWRSHTAQLADDTRHGVFVARATGHIVHALFLAMALWIPLNPMFTPRHLGLHTLPLLYCYVWALAAGYCAGYILLFGLTRRPAAKRWSGPVPALVVTGLIGVLPAVLLWKNYAAVQLTNGRAVREFTRQLYQDLPAGSTTALCDDLRLLLLVRAEVAARGPEKQPMLISARAFPQPAYQRWLAGEYGERWPSLPETNRTEPPGPPAMIATLLRIATNEPVVYLHPSSGLVFEHFDSRPNGWIQELQPRSGAKRDHSVRDETWLEQNDRLWQARWNETLAQRSRQMAASRQRAAQLVRPPLNSLKLSVRRNETGDWLAALYSKSLNHWGVLRQRMGNWPGAEEWFRRASVVDPDNLSAHINLEFATRRREGNPERLTPEWLREHWAPLLAKYDSWSQALSRNGPVDEPTLLLQSGGAYFAGGHLRQAEELFGRCRALAPDWPAPYLWQARTRNALGDFAGTLEVAAELAGPKFALEGANQAQLLQVRVVALRQLGQTNEAAALLDRMVAEPGAPNEVLEMAATCYEDSGAYRPELTCWDLLLKRDPTRIDWWMKKGLAELRLDQPEAAYATLTRALALSPNHGEARLRRAVAALLSGKLDLARRDYQDVLKDQEHLESALFGLGEIAWREQATNAIIEYYQLFLTNHHADSLQFKLAAERLRLIQEQ